MKNINKLTKLIETTELLQVVNEQAQTEWDNDIENTELEDIADASYSKFWKACETLAKEIQQITSNTISYQTAMRMAFHKRNEIITAMEKSIILVKQ